MTSMRWWSFQEIAVRIRITVSDDLPLPDDPRLEPLVRAVLKRERLDPSWVATVRGLATGEIGPAALQCCGSGCRPCVKELRSYAGEVLDAWRDPAAERRLLDSALGKRQRLRRLAGRLLGRARG